jgi:hypothetical protein
MRLGLAFALAALAVVLPVSATAQTPAVDKTIATERATVLQIDAGGGDMTLVPDAAVGSVRIRIDQSGASGEPPAVTSSVHAKNLVVTIGGGGGTSMVPFAAAASMAYTIDYPATMKLDLRVSSGGVHVVRPSAAVQLYAGDGDVTIDAPTASVTAEAAHGALIATSASAAVDLQADLGDVNAQLSPTWTGNEVRIQSAQGAIHLIVPAGFRGKFDVTSGTGNVHNEVSKSNATKPLVWLYAPAGDVSISIAR